MAFSLRGSGRHGKTRHSPARMGGLPVEVAFGGRKAPRGALSPGLGPLSREGMQAVRAEAPARNAAGNCGAADRCG